MRFHLIIVKRILLYVLVFISTSTFGNGNITGIIHDSLYKEIPKCPKPQEVFYKRVNQTSIVITWNDFSAQPSVLEYEIRYRPKNSARWETEVATNGNEFLIIGLKPGSEYNFEIRKICYWDNGNESSGSEWEKVWPMDSRTPSGSQCDSLGNIEVQGISGHNIVFSVIQSYNDLIVEQECNIIFLSYWCDPGGVCRSLYSVYDNDSIYINFIDDLERYYIIQPNNYLSEVYAFVVCPDSIVLPPGEVYSEEEWDSLAINEICSDTLLYSAPDILNHDCGEDVEITNPNQTPLQSASVGDTFKIGSYPFTLTSVSGSNGTFSGTADLKLPFQGITINIPFNSINVNLRKEVYGGSITIQSDPLFDPDEVGTFEIGGDICIPPAEPEYWDSTGNNSVTGLPWDVYGFGADSTYVKEPPYPGWEEGDPYDPDFDPNGFDHNGIHVLTNSPYNEFGCDRNGLDTLGQPCNPAGPGPYYWLNNNSLGPETAEGIAFANEIEDTLAILITQVLESMEDNLNDSITAQRTDCNEIRSDMDDLMLVLGYDEDYIYGPNNEYYAEGMHENFQSKPQPFQVTMERDQNTISLETNHISLYECDYKLGVFLKILAFVEDYLEVSGLADLKGILLEKIKRFTADEVVQYSSTVELLKWIEDEIIKELNAKYKNTYGEIIGMHYDEKDTPNNKVPWEFTEIEEAYASLSIPYHTKSRFHPTLNVDKNYAAMSQFRNGDLYINGTHRALILDHMVKDVNYANLLVTDPVMPVRISLEVQGKIYTILIDRIELTTTGANLDAFLVIDDQNTGQKLVFQGLDIEFGPNGIVSGGNLSLASDVSIRLSNAAKLILHNSGDTYVAWDCNGFAGMGVDASIEFCPEFLTPLDTNTLELITDDSARVRAHFKVNLPSWGDFVAEISIDPFAVTKAEQIRWVVSEATLDFSTIETPEIEFPSIYNSAHVQNGIPSETWKGFHLKQLSATFPNNFSEDTSQITIGVENLIFDDRGFTGELYVASNIVSLENGNLMGWPFSIDTLNVVFIANNLMEGGISGLINVPLFESTLDPDPGITAKDCFSYSAQMTTGGGFCFKVSTANNSLKAPLFKAGEIILLPNSGIIISAHDTAFIAKATLNGSLTLNASLTPSIALNLSKIDFEGFEVSNVAPYFSPGLWSIPGSLNINVGGFKASIREIKLVRADEDDEVALSINLGLGLGGEDLDLWAEARTQVIGKLEVADGRQKWVYDRFKIDQVYIDADIKGNRVKGGLLFYEDEPIYNQGFRGVLSLDITSLKVSVMAVAQFGKHEEDYKYFFVDALANIQGGIGAGTFKILGIGGGLYYHMSRDTSSVSPIPSAPTGIPSLGALGVGLSNIVYIPNDGISFGFKATVVFATTSEKAFNGNATFEIAFNSGGGIAEIGIEGNARFMSIIDFGASPIFAENSSTPPLNLPLSAYVSIRYDFNNEILEGDLNVFLNTPTFSGVGPNGQLVWAKLYFSPNAWYVNIGTPSNPCGVVLNIPGIGELAEVTAYLDIGTNIEPMPPLPANVASLTGAIRPHPMRGTGKGFAFGAAIHINTGEIKFLVLRASLEAAVGFDVLVQDYGEATCYHSGNKPGINGWYATGQVYAFLEGKVGVKAFGKLYPILELGIAAALQARLPNPVWLNGAFGVRYRLLGGIIKGNHRFRFTIGQLCELVHPDGDSSVLDQEIIQDITPPHTSNGVQTDPLITVYFNYGINQTVTDVEGTNSYLIKVKKVELKWEDNFIPGEIEIEEGGYALTFQPAFHLPEMDTMHFKITVDVLQNGVVIESESDSIWFITSTRPQTIPSSNIIASYPLNGQFNFYPKERLNQIGYIMLDYGQPYLFVENNIEIWLIKSDGSSYSLNYNYDFIGRLISFNLPEDILEHGSLYKIAVVRLDNSGPVEIPGINLPGLKPGTPHPDYMLLDDISDLSLGNYDVLTQLVFRVSIFDSFKAKVNLLAAEYAATYSQDPKILSVTPEIYESWGYHEIPNSGFDPMVQVTANIPKWTWYSNNIYPYLYKIWPGQESSSYPYSVAFSQVPFLNRSNHELDIPPINAFHIPPPKMDDSFVSEEHFLSGSINSGQMQKLLGNFHLEMMKDWNDVKQQLQSYYLNDPDGLNADPNASAAQYLLSHDFPTYSGTEHYLIWEYRLPGTNQLTSSIPMTITATNQ